jgi:hypothetical protein
MNESEDILDEILRSMSEQPKLLGGRLSEEEAIECRARTERIEMFLDSLSQTG